MTLDQLRYFIAVASHQHVGRAARAVHISASVISNTIASLEKELNVALFDRQGRKIILTPMGQDLKARAESILKEISDLPSALKGSPLKLQGEFRLAASPFLAPRFLSPAWGELQKQHPDLIGSVFAMDTALTFNEIIAGRVDFGLCFSPLTHPSLAATPIYDGAMTIAVRKKHPILAHSSQQQLARLKDYPAAMHRSSFGNVAYEVRSILDQFEIQPKKIQFYFDNDDVLIPYIQKSDAWTFLPDIVVKSHASSLEAIKSPKGWSAPIQVLMVTSRNRDLKNFISTFMPFIKKQLH